MMSIGSVLARLRDDFPDVTISKIRFLESEGLITPERAPSGYRRFNESDYQRLRFVLTAQRDRYLPLKVIREQLDAMDQEEHSRVTMLSSARGRSRRRPISVCAAAGSRARNSSSEPVPTPGSSPS